MWDYGILSVIAPSFGDIHYGNELQNGCWQCHGTLGQGSIATSGGKRIAPDPLPWEAFSGFVRSSNRAMPPFSEKILSDADLADIYAYLQSVPKPPADITLLK